MKRISVAAFLTALLAYGTISLAASPDAYNVVWNSPSKDCHSSMPLGNGEIGLNAWVEPDGDLCFYIGRTDSWGDNSRLLKVGLVRISLEPSPLDDSTEFRQVLRLQDATMLARCGEGDDATKLRLWVDANRPVIHVEIDGSRPSTAKAHIELWRTERHELPGLEVSDVLLNRSQPDNKHGPTIVEPDTVLTGLEGRIGWCHHNRKSVGPKITMKVQGIYDLLEEDPIWHRTFGAVVTAQDGERIDDRTLASRSRKTHRFDIYALTRHPSTPDEWLQEVDATIARAEKTPFTERRRAHEQWWAEFWNRSWIEISPSDDYEPAPLIPGNDHRVRIGRDQAGHNRFKGEMARVSLIGNGLSEARIGELASGDLEDAFEQENGVLFTGQPELPAELKDSKDWAYENGLTIEAWVHPEKMPQRGGRIVDDLTPGRGDGYLLDTYPGNSLRLIVGDVILQKKDILKPGNWWHVAATIDQDTGRIRLYLNGEMLAQRKIEQRSDAFVVSRGYTLQRFIDACAGRGNYPIKFNGSIFTVPYEGRPGDADYRRWGPGYWWQNTRLPYYSMCASGDYEMMRPLFEMYAEDLLDLCKARTKRYFDHGGAYVAECIYFWGAVFSDTYGWQPASERTDKLQKSGYHKWEWVSGLELSWLMLDYYQHTLDEEFLRKTAIPYAHEIVKFFDEHYPVNENGKLVMHPSQALETWWDCTNPMPEVAGLHAVTERLLGLPDDLTTSEQREYWRALRKKLPEVPTRTEDGTEMLAPAERFEQKRNIENPELYAVFPFRLIALEDSNKDLAIQALRHRWDRGHAGWRQDDIFVAYLGLAEDARENLVSRARESHSGSRFPAFWGPNYDWIPDQDHGSVLMKATQAMLMQTEGRKIYLLPAWPKGWNVHFKLHAPRRTTVECRYEDGRISLLEVSPRSRADDIILPETLAR